MEAQHCTQPCFIVYLLRPSQPLPWRSLPPPFPSAFPSVCPNPKPMSHFRIFFSANYPRWDSNAETSRSPKFNFNFRGKEEQEQDEEEDDNDDEDDDDEVNDYGKKRPWWSDRPPGMDEGTSGFREEGIDGVWIFKAFKSFGWTLPVVLVSWLLATGPKAFLMALALPLGQSALSLAFEKLWGRAERKPKRKYRMRRKPRTGNGTRVEKKPEETQKTRKGKTAYQTWVAENNGSVDRGSREAPSFGGWEDLERSRPATRSSRVMNGSQRMPTEKGRLSRRERKSDTPLLLRLLIALFPFLGTWTKMLW